ncbi:unnamed protein product [Cylindrotheca closterium]|uniref:Uncharacterized protein n=1 Tax=Cylindrotheca closterium TaxID=2856 RepID=A0AAD2D183_9STRA|nr:unnamed protein product [Cylindrotheca closterium]
MMTPNRVAVVTGANKGIGYFIALQLGMSGLFSNIILGCRDVQRGTTAANQIQALVQSKADTKIEFSPLVIGDEATHSTFCEKMKKEFGKVDVLVNNAGFAYKGVDPTPFEGQTEKTLSINYFGLVDFTQKMLPLVRKGSDPRIVNVASMAGRLGQVSSELQKKFSEDSLTIDELNTLMNQFKSGVQAGTYKADGWSSSNYGMSKLGVIAATKIWARQEPTIKINACCPGYCATDMSSHKGSRSAQDGAKNAVIPATTENPPTGEFFRDYEISTW